MSGRVFAIALALFAGGCNSSTDRTSAEVVLRVSAGHALLEFFPAADIAGSTAYALELAYVPLDAHFKVVARDGVEVKLRRLETSPHSAEALAASLAFKGLDRLERDGDDLTAYFVSEEIAAAFSRGQVGCLALGPYELIDQHRTEAGTPDRSALRARPGASVRIDVIELVSVPEGEQWRRLMARDIDVVPVQSGAYRTEFEGLRSVRLVDMRDVHQTTVYFNVQHEALRSAEVRRQIASVVDAAAIAEVVCGGQSCRQTHVADGSREPGALPQALSILVLESDSSLVLAARVLRQQLHEAGVAVEIEALELEQLNTRFQRRDFELFMLPGPRDDSHTTFLSDGRRNISGYANPAYDAAVAAREFEHARDILKRDPPAISLYEMRSFAAIDERFCGGNPESVHEWGWLAELYPCEDEAHP